MQAFTIIIALFFISLNTFASEKVVKTYDGHRVICQNQEQAINLAKAKAVTIKPVGDGQHIEIELVKCTEAGWVRDPQPNSERVDEPFIVDYAIYQIFLEYNLAVLNENRVVQQVKLSDLLKTGYEVIELNDWKPSSEIFFSALVQKQDDNGRIIDEKHPESFGTFNLSEETFTSH